MNNSDLSLDFLKKCQKCRENGVPNDMAILAALQDLADWKDQHPREGRWSSEKVVKFIKEPASEDLEREIGLYTTNCLLGKRNHSTGVYHLSQRDCDDIARHFAEFGRNHFEDKSEMVSENLEEAAQKELEDTLEVTMSCQCANIAYEEFLQGAKYALTHQWISVEEALPEKNTMCFVRKETKIGIIYDADYVDWEGKWFFNSNRPSIESMVITHWMMIPTINNEEK